MKQTNDQERKQVDLKGIAEMVQLAAENIAARKNNEQKPA